VQNGKSEEMIRIRVLPEEATEVAEWAGLMLSELVGSEVPGDGTPVRLRDPERAAELLELLMLCTEEGADASAALAPAMKLCEAEPAAEGPKAGSYPEEAFTSRAADSAAQMPQTADWHPYYGSGAPDFADPEPDSAYRSREERESVLMAVRFGASALIDLARSHGLDVPERQAGGRGHAAGSFRS